MFYVVIWLHGYMVYSQPINIMITPCTQSTLRAVAPAGATSRESASKAKIPYDISSTHTIYEHIIELLLAHPCYLNRAYKHFLSGNPCRANEDLPGVDHVQVKWFIYYIIII